MKNKKALIVVTAFLSGGVCGFFGKAYLNLPNNMEHNNDNVKIN